MALPTTASRTQSPAAGVTTAAPSADPAPFADHEYGRMREYEDEYWWYRGLRALTIRAIRRHCSTPRPLILDAGCGTGGELAALAGAFPAASLTGIDVSATAVGMARARGIGALARAGTQALPFPDGLFDVVCSLDVLYIRGVDERAALTDLFRVLRPGGILVVNLPAFEALRGAHDVAVATRHRFRRGEVRLLLQEAGFAVEALTYWNLLAFLPIAVARRLSRRAPAAQAKSDFRPLPAPANNALAAWLGLEGRLALRWGLVLGTSVFAVGRRPA